MNKAKIDLPLLDAHYQKIRMDKYKKLISLFQIYGKNSPKFKSQYKICLDAGFTEKDLNLALDIYNYLPVI